MPTVTRNIERCSCEESAHLRAALNLIRDIATRETIGTSVDDLTMIAALALQALTQRPLTGRTDLPPLDTYVLKGNA